jgi:pimeloyl-ACP methyl ester carboxylesterase
LDGLIWFDSTSEREVPGLFLQWHGRDGERAHFTLLYSLGNVQDLGQSVTWLKLLMDTLHVDILCFDYTGYGLNEGKPSEQSCFDDIYTAFVFLTVTRKVPADRILLFGKSMGSGPCLELASKIYAPLPSATKERSATLRGIRGAGGGSRRGTSPSSYGSGSHFQHPLIDIHKSLAGIILQSPMTSILNIERDKGNSGLLDTVTSLITNDMVPYSPSPFSSSFSILPSSPFSSSISCSSHSHPFSSVSHLFLVQFENYKKLDNIQCPVFIMHGSEDEVIPFVHSKVSQATTSFPLHFSSLLFTSLHFSSLLFTSLLASHPSLSFSFSLFLSSSETGAEGSDAVEAVGVASRPPFRSRSSLC